LVDGALDDFIQADLSRADLTSIDLGGIRWSLSGTQWPPGFDVEELLLQSDETAPGSGVWAVRLRGQSAMLVAAR
jgi:hypothetical protein